VSIVINFHIANLINFEQAKTVLFIITTSAGLFATYILPNSLVLLPNYI
jgi:hypothetical protein